MQDKTKILLNKPLSIEEQFAKRPRLWWVYTLVVLIVASIIVWSGSGIEFNGIKEKGSEVARGVLHGIIKPDLNLLFQMDKEGVIYLLFETVAIAILGTLFGAVLAIPFSFLASSNIVPRPVCFIVRSIILLIRTIPGLVWALVWIRVTGPGPFCGVVTQSICSIGMLSKMFINAIEDIDTRILESLDAAGCTTFQKIRYGIIPQLTANFVSTVIYRFDINMKDATTLGIVGAGGIGSSLIQCIQTSRWSMVGSFLLGLVVFMLIIEFISTRLRHRLARGEV